MLPPTNLQVMQRRTIRWETRHDGLVFTSIFRDLGNLEEMGLTEHDVMVGRCSNKFCHRYLRFRDDSRDKCGGEVIQTEKSTAV